jgi:hypothetical protein
MEKKGVAVTASLVFVALLSGILLGGTVARPPPVVDKLWRQLSQSSTSQPHTAP